MRKIFVYYSLSGNGDAVADYLKTKGFEIRKLVTEKKIGKMSFFRMIHYGKKATFHQKEKLLPYEFREEEGDLVVIGTPIWADRVSTPVNAFLAQEKLRTPHPVFLLYSGSGHSKKVKRDLRKIYPEAQFIDLRNPASEPEAMKKALVSLLSEEPVK
jgi:hypothetical protein